MKYAPIIIPTLNRVLHLKRCINSLLLNKEAILTDLYISVDYPPNKKYINGYAEVKRYVKTIKGFKSVNLFFQSTNLGPGKNRAFLEKKIKTDNHNRYIFTDDDNEFSKNFLSFINWGLEKYKDDDSIYAICSTLDSEVVGYQNNKKYLIISAYTPFGSGHWIHKNDSCELYLNQKSIDDIYRDKTKQQKLLYYFPLIYYIVAKDSIREISETRGENDGLTYIDIWENVYCVENDKRCVFPCLPKSRNWGHDGSGVHFDNNNIENYIPKTLFDDSSCWEWNSTEISKEEEAENIIARRRLFEISTINMFKAHILYILNFVFGNRIVLYIYRLFHRNSIKKDDIKYG